MFRKVIVILLVSVLMVFTTGCWGKTELNEIGIVTMTGIDLEPDGSMRITVLSVQPEGPSNTPQLRSYTWIGTATGVDLVDAAKNLRRTAVKKLSWIHNSIIVIGQEAAKSKMGEVIDFFSRNREIRFSSHMLVAEGKALNMLETPAKVQRDLYTEIEGLIRDKDRGSKSYAANLKQFLVSYAQRSSNLVTGKIWYTEEQMNTFSTAREDYEKLVLNGRKLPVAYIEGCAVFKNGSFVGWLDGQETRGYLWVIGKVRPGGIIAGKAGSLAMENIFSDTSVKMEIEDGSYKAHIKVDVRGTLMEQTTKDDILKTAVIQEVEDQFADAIKAEMEKTVNKVQKVYNVDVLRFSTIMNRQYPQEWKKIEKDWNDTIFSKVKVEYDVKVTIRRTGKIIRTIM